MKWELAESKTILHILELREAVECFLNTAWNSASLDKCKGIKVKMKIKEEKIALTVFAELKILK